MNVETGEGKLPAADTPDPGAYPDRDDDDDDDEDDVSNEVGTRTTTTSTGDDNLARQSRSPPPLLPRLNMDLLSTTSKYTSAASALDFSNVSVADRAPSPAMCRAPAAAPSSYRSGVLARLLIRLGIDPDKHQAFVSGLRRYLLLLIVVTVASLGRTTDGVSFGWSDFLRERFAPGHNRFRADGMLLQAFDSVQTVDAFWRYMQNTFVDALRPTPSMYAGIGPIAGSTILGSINLHQDRVQAITCAPGATDCVPARITPLRPSLASYGPDEQFKASADADADLNSWFWSPHGHVGTDFSQLLTPDPDPDAVASQLAQLRQLSWVDIATDSVLVEFALYNAQIGLMCAASLEFRMPAYGGVQAHASFRAVDVFQFSTTGDYIVTAFELAVVVLALDLLRGTVTSLVRGERDFWLLLDVLILTGVFVVAGFRIVFAVVVPELLQRTVSRPYTNWQCYAYTSQQLLKLVGILSLLTSIKVLKFMFVLTTTLRLLEQTFVAARTRVLTFSLLFALVVLGFAQAFFMAFNVEIDGFRSLPRSLMTLLGAMLHGYDMAEIQKQNWLLGPLLYVVFVVCASLILVNMFLAIVHAAYHNVRELETDEQRSKHVSDVIKATIDIAQRRSNSSTFRASVQGIAVATPRAAVAVSRDRHLDGGHNDHLALPGQVPTSSFSDSPMQSSHSDSARDGTSPH